MSERASAPRPSTLEPGPFPVAELLPDVSLVRKGIERLFLAWTPAGRIYLAGLTAVGVIAAGFTISYGMYSVAALLFAVGAVDGILGFLLRPRAELLSRGTPLRCSAGATVTARVRLRHTGRLPGFDLALREDLVPRRVHHPLEVELLPRADPGEEFELTARFKAVRRGSYELPGPDLLTAFPFGLYLKRRRIAAPQRLLVTPHFEPLSDIRLPSGRRHQPGGLQLVSQVGDSEEFIGNREYRPGDRIRDLHHAAWARVGKPVVREFQQEYLTRIALVVDTHLTRRSVLLPAEVRALEAAISLGAAVADVLSRQEYVIDLFAAGPELYHFQAGRHLAFLDDVLDVLACIEHCPRDPFPDLSPAVGEALAQISTAVVVFLDWDESRRDFARLLAESGVEVMVLVVKDGPTTLDATGFVTAAGEVRRFTVAEVEAGVGSL
ncbi:MAG: DUF58 domain-containing protein [Planctomycetota bacterium]